MAIDDQIIVHFIGRNIPLLGLSYQLPTSGVLSELPINSKTLKLDGLTFSLFTTSLPVIALLDTRMKSVFIS